MKSTWHRVIYSGHWRIASLRWDGFLCWTTGLPTSRFRSPYCSPFMGHHGRWMAREMTLNCIFASKNNNLGRNLIWMGGAKSRNGQKEDGSYVVMKCQTLWDTRSSWGAFCSLSASHFWQWMGDKLSVLLCEDSVHVRGPRMRFLFSVASVASGKGCTEEAKAQGPRVPQFPFSCSYVIEWPALTDSWRGNGEIVPCH